MLARLTSKVAVGPICRNLVAFHYPDPQGWGPWGMDNFFNCIWSRKDPMTTEDLKLFEVSLVVGGGGGWDSIKEELEF